MFSRAVFDSGVQLITCLAVANGVFGCVSVFFFSFSFLSFPSLFFPFLLFSFLSFSSHFLRILMVDYHFPCRLPESLDDW